MYNVPVEKIDDFFEKFIETFEAPSVYEKINNWQYRLGNIGDIEIGMRFEVSHSVSDDGKFGQWEDANIAVIYMVRNGGDEWEDVDRDKCNLSGNWTKGTLTRLPGVTDRLKENISAIVTTLIASYRKKED